MTFRPGDHVVYPTYGAGTVTSLEDRVFAGTSTRYYILNMVADEGTFMVPVEQADALGLRPVVEKGYIEVVLQAPFETLSDDYKERQLNIEKLISTSDAEQLAIGARNLAWFAGSHNLTGRDMQLYENLQTQLASELSLVEDISLATARENLSQLLAAIAEQAALAAAALEDLLEEE